jgi:D-xylose transport system substrate-binding protein
MQKIRGFFLINLFVAILLISGCIQTPTDQANKPADANKTTAPADGKVKIGFSMATVQEERWQRDRDAFQEHCKKMNVECVLTFADKKAEKQLSDVEQLLTQGINVLVVAPHDATQAAQIVEKAKAKGVPVISYDRLINSDKIDVYISHQVPVIGKKIAEYALQKVPKGNYVMVYGASTDNNAVIMKKEQLAVLQPAIDKGDVKIVADNFMTDWKAEEAQKFAENALTQNQDKIDAFVVSNDGMASGVIAALSPKGLVGKILVTGQDAEKAALQRIAEGKQTMTVYKPIIPLASAAVEAAIKLAKKETLADAKPFMNDNIKKEIPAILLEVTIVDKDNLLSTVIKDGYASFDEVYKNVPADQRPKQ